MAEPAQPTSVSNPPLGPVGRLVATLVDAARPLRPNSAANRSDELFRQLDRHEDFLEKAWPGSHPSADGASAHNRAVSLREKALRSRNRITAALGWAEVFVKLSRAAVAIGFALYLLLK